MLQRIVIVNNCKSRPVVSVAAYQSRVMASPGWLVLYAVTESRVCSVQLQLCGASVRPSHRVAQSGRLESSREYVRVSLCVPRAEARDFIQSECE